MQRRLAYIAAACRTPIGTYNGGLAQFSAPELGAFATKAVFERCNVPKESVDEVYFGNVCGAGIGQNPARQVCIKSGLPESVTCTTVNKVCASGMKSISLGAQAIKCGDADIVVAGGMENMSMVPHYHIARNAVKLGDVKIADGMVKDGLTDVYNQVHIAIQSDIAT